MKNFVHRGDVIDVVAGGTISAGDFIVSGRLCGVAACDAESGDTYALHRVGVFTLPKTTSEAWTLGQQLYWNSSTSKLTTDSSKGIVAAVAAAAADSADTTGDALIGSPESGLRFAAGQVTTATAIDTVVTGLTTVVACGASLDDSPGDDPMLATASKGDQAGTPAAGSILVKTWKNTGGTDPTPAAASTFSKKVNWWAAGV
jgi:predicted RecA/RadA family phage recombinase